MHRVLVVVGAPSVLKQPISTVLRSLQNGNFSKTTEQWQRQHCEGKERSNEGGFVQQQRNSGLEAIQYLKGVGPARAEALARSGIRNVEDLVYYLPRGYIDRTAMESIRQLRQRLSASHHSPLFENSEVALYSEVTVVGRVVQKELRSLRNHRSLLVVTIRDDSGNIAEMLFWNGIEYYRKRFHVGEWLAISGRPELGRYGQVQFHHPEVETLDEEDAQTYRQGGILPKYPMTQAMHRARITSKVMRKIIRSALERYLPELRDPLPKSLLEKYRFLDRATALQEIHFPTSPQRLQQARYRLKFEEIFFFELLLALRHRGLKLRSRALPMLQKSPRARQLLDSLPFELTGAQKRVLREIIADLQRSEPMNRLLQGDVGSGKTIVAALAIVYAVDNGFQAAIMAPTEILAEQHFHTFQQYLEPLDITVVQLVGGQKQKLRRELLEQIASGEANVIVGTHALFQQTVEYHRLGLIVIDEQHRFGVMQRAALRERAMQSYQQADVAPHILVMSATPIPRTLAMTLYGDLDVSIIDEMPKGRKPVMTKVVFESDLPELYQFVREQVQQGYQAYFVYPLVEQSEKLQLKSAVEHYEYLQQKIFPDLRIGLLHGQMFWYEKEDVMRAFKNREYDILVATTVIEVGIDVPQATIMVIENAERFGLAQLHQLRGRVGRGAAQSYCFLVTKDHFRYHLSTKDAASERSATIVRLRTMERTTNGFEIAEVDLQLRGPGDLLGTRQSGLPEFRFIDLVRDGNIISEARREAFAIVERDPQLRTPPYRQLREELLSRFQEEMMLLDVA